jgi:hypothetical protein
MNKPVTLITVALLSFGFTAASMAADMPKSAAPMAADTGTSAPAAKSHKHSSSKKHKKSHSTAAPTK